MSLLVDAVTSRAILIAAHEEALKTDAECHNALTDLNGVAERAKEEDRKLTSETIQIATEAIASLERLKGRTDISRSGKERVASSIDKRVIEQIEKRAVYDHYLRNREATLVKILGNRGPLLLQLCQAIRVHQQVEEVGESATAELPSFLERVKRAWETSTRAYVAFQHLIKCRTQFTDLMSRPETDRPQVWRIYEAYRLGWRPSEQFLKTMSPTTVACKKAFEVWDASQDQLKTLGIADLAGGNELAMTSPV